MGGCGSADRVAPDRADEGSTDASAPDEATTEAQATDAPAAVEKPVDIKPPSFYIEADSIHAALEEEVEGLRSVLLLLPGRSRYDLLEAWLGPPPPDPAEEEEAAAVATEASPTTEAVAVAAPSPKDDGGWRWLRQISLILH